MLIVTSQNPKLIEENALTDAIVEVKDKFISFLFKKADALPKNIKSVEKTLSENGFDVDAIKKDAKSAGENLRTPENGKSSDFVSRLNKFIVDLSNKKYVIDSSGVHSKTKYQTAKSDQKGAELDPTLKIVASLGTAAVVIFINNALLSVATRLIGDEKIAYKIISIFIAPLVEEYMKMQATKYSLLSPNFATFDNTTDFQKFIGEYVATGLNPVQMFLKKVPNMLVGLLTNVIHSEAKKRNNTTGGYQISVAVRIIWNLLTNLMSAS